MGLANCACKRAETDEDILSKIFSYLLIKEKDVNDVYRDFLLCINTDKKKSNKIDKNLFSNFLCTIINPHYYRDNQVDYFQTLLELADVSEQGIKRIGAILILQSGGKNEDRINLLDKHVTKYYGSLDRHVKDFISDTVEMNTEVCLIAFKNSIDGEVINNLTNIWKKQRKQKIIQLIYNQYQDSKNENKTENSHLYCFLAKSISDLNGDSIRNTLQQFYTTENTYMLSQKK